MGGKTLTGIALIVLGILALAFQGFTYTTSKKAVDLGPLQVTKQEHHSVPLPPILGGLALIGGIFLVATSREK